MQIYLLKRFNYLYISKKLKSVFDDRMYLSLFKNYKDHQSIKEKNLLELSLKLNYH